MFYTIERLEKILDRSETFVRTLLMRYDIKQSRLKITKEIAYNIPQSILKQMIEFSQNRKIAKRKKVDVKSEIEKLIQEADWKLEALPDKYFIDYFEEEFIEKLKKLIKKIK